jgi:UDP-4-amino-4,6-dideoxy-N-acetyl-beta-L-altrosamine transaminase
MIPYGKQSISKSDIEAVKKVLKSDFITQGPKVPEFEKKVKNFVGSKYAFAMNSATSSLHIACLAIGLKKGDFLWTSSNSFVASANCGIYCGAKIDFVDIDPNSYNMDMKLLKEKLEIAKKNKKLPKVVIPVHMAGQSCDMKTICALSKQYGFKIIEDASHGIGSKYNDKYVGGCQYSDITVFSFHPVKIITTGEGGVATTNSRALAKKIDILRTHGITKNKKDMINPSHGPWYFEQLELGFNYRMTDIHASLGINQMKSLKKFVTKRNSLARNYNNLLKALPLSTPEQSENTLSSFHLYIVRVDLKKLKNKKNKIFNLLRKKGIGVNVHYIPIHYHPFYQNLKFKKGYLPETEKYYEEALSLPIYPDLSFKDQKYIVNSLEEVLK